VVGADTVLLASVLVADGEGAQLFVFCFEVVDVAGYSDSLGTMKDNAQAQNTYVSGTWISRSLSGNEQASGLPMARHDWQGTPLEHLIFFR
jgi:hypothetical protein